MELNKRHSGYNSNESNWDKFLDCWRVKLVVIDDQTNHGLLRFSDHQLPSKSKEQTSVVNPALPTSVIDFYKAYKKLGGLYRDETINDGIGIFAPQEIQPLALYMNELLEIKKRYSFESSTEDYFRYGIEQDDADARTSYLSNSIVIGQYGWSDYELIVIHPNAKTWDGEMETAIFAHASQARTPSFAEMMRQLSFYNLKSPDSIPLYSQKTLSGTCADLLPLDNIWWK